MIAEIHTTCRDEKEAENIAAVLLEKKLVVCANYFPVNSRYRWQGKIEKDSEVMLVLKTNEKNKDNAVSEIKSLHAYQLPVITVSKVECSKAVCAWADVETA